MRIHLRHFVKRAVVGLADRSVLIRRGAAFVVANATSGPESRDTYGYLKQRFIKLGQASRFPEATRRDIIRRFEHIDRDVPIASAPTDGLFLAEMLLNMDAEGDIVECGCYAGGSSAKLSILAKLLQRNLVVCDSFEGLPVTEPYYLRDRHCRRDDEWVSDWSAGRYAARVEHVRSNIERHGDLSVCRFVKGWFNETLTPENLPKRIAFAFVDVDLANSARDCFVAIWPGLSERGVYVTHDTAYIKVLQELYSPELWRNTFRSIPPILFGAGYGLCNSSPHLGYMVKGEHLSAEYLKSLTIDR
jgi:O-methyltransferase